MALGIPELVIILVIGLVIFGARKLAPFGSTTHAPVAGLPADGVLWRTPVHPRADARYAVGPAAGAVAELLGLGREGIRVPQVIVLAVGTWLANNVQLLARPEFFNFGITAFLWPVVFLGAAITAVRSFQSAFAAALCAGLLYAPLSVGIQYAASFSGDAEPMELARIVDLLVTGFFWPFLTMLAIHFAVSGSARWVRLAIALTAEEAAQNYVGRAVFLDSWEPSFLLEAGQLSPMFTTAIVWTFAFWVGSALFGERRVRA